MVQCVNWLNAVIDRLRWSYTKHVCLPHVILELRDRYVSLQEVVPAKKSTLVSFRDWGDSTYLGRRWGGIAGGGIGPEPGLELSTGVGLGSGVGGHRDLC